MGLGVPRETMRLERHGHEIRLVTPKTGADHTDRLRTFQCRQRIAAWRATGAAVYVPYFCTLLADVSDSLAYPEDGLQALAEAHTLMEQYEERWWEVEIYRLRGVVLLRQTGTQQEEVETWLRRALDVVRRQEAKSLELRAAVCLSRLWQRQGKRQEAYDLLAPIYGWFTEGFERLTSRRPRRCWRR
jgi:predicted ATPase